MLVMKIRVIYYLNLSKTMHKLHFDKVSSNEESLKHFDATWNSKGGKSRNSFFCHQSQKTNISKHENIPSSDARL